MGYVLPPPHDPTISYEENLHRLDAFIRRNNRWSFVYAPLVGIVAAAVIFAASEYFGWR